ILQNHAPRLKFVQLVNAGYDKLEVYGFPAAIQVANAGGSWSPAVAEHAMALLLAMVKCLPQAFDAQRRATWERAFTSGMDGLTGKTLLILGFGSIGREVARRARSFDM